MDRFVIGSIRDPHPGPNPASSEATDTPSTSLSANASGAPGYLNLPALSRPNLNLFPKGKYNRCFRPRLFEPITAPTDELNSASEVAKTFLIYKVNCPAHRRSQDPPIEMSPMTKM